MSDQENTPLARAFIDEVHRVASHVPLGVQHWTSQQVELDGFIIPANSIIIPNISEVHQEAGTWGSDSQQFRPERLLDSEGQYQRRREIIPYSTGVRRCPGESLAKSEIYLAITALIQHFHFSSPPGVSKPGLDYKFGFTLTPKHFLVNIEPRL